ncbi:MAG: hypothetical protein ACYCSG_03880 [Thermoplasmataceae archaeon]
MITNSFVYSLETTLKRIADIQFQEPSKPIDLSVLGDSKNIRDLIASESFKRKNDVITIEEMNKFLELIMAVCTPFQGNEVVPRTSEFYTDGLKLLRFFSEIKEKAGE